MWHLALVLAIAAGTYSCHACPESCECHQLPEPEDLAALVQVACLGRTPRVVDLSSTTRRLRVIDAEESELLGLLEELANATLPLPYLDEFEFTNCSLTTLNSSPWSSGSLERVRILNISRNHFTDFEEVRTASRSNLTSLTILDVSRNHVSNLSAETFGTLPVLARLCLKGNDISHVDADAFLGLELLEDLDLSDNRLVTLPDKALTPLESLQKLDLSGNQLKILGAGWFESLGRLRELDVSRNGLARAASGALQPIPGLSVLRLAGNPLRERDVSLLLGTGRKLETVDASRTGLIRVPAALTRSVRALRLAGNKLTSIRGGDLDSYPLLRLLDMSDNRLIDVEVDALGRLEVLDDLDVSGNFLTEVPKSLPGSLTSLNLDRNPIKILRFNDLQGLWNLRSLSLRKNSVTEIQEGAFGQLLALEVLDISDNPIKELPANTLNGPPCLNILRMSGLGSLRWNQREQGDMTFPVPAPERLADLDVSGSPVLAAQLLADTAALSACKSLVRLNLERTNLTSIRSDLIYFVPQLRALGLGGNSWCCNEDLYWLGEWSRDHSELEPLARCSEEDEGGDLGGIYLRELPSPPTPPSTTSIEAPSEPSASITGTIKTPETLNTEGNRSSTSSRETTDEEDRVRDDYPATEPLRFDPGNDTNLETDGEPTESESTTARMTLESAKKIKQMIYEIKSATRNPTAHSILLNASHRLSPPRNNRPLQIATKSTIATRRRNDSVSNLSSTSGSEREVKSEKKSKESVEVKVATEGSAKTVAEELSGRATDSDARISEALSAGAHPGMLVLVGAALGAAAALSVVLSKRATARRRDCCYQRQENIEVHTLTPVTELW
ncbi:insulin-like growth factor-binding protein complex acid labile subunit [Athalia rosae]|uniref:insulin-like growth factor-binding protein complex acid labile subunit n=1 Tax=Athalia rosae TaxID=37344 RepID=UPI0020342223|nr:insulin-like growth factor-binding protein complex acid labile subunit [Athalia rosae]